MLNPTVIIPVSIISYYQRATVLSCSLYQIFARQKKKSQNIMVNKRLIMKPSHRTFHYTKHLEVVTKYALIITSEKTRTHTHIWAHICIHKINYQDWLPELVHRILAVLSPAHQCFVKSWQHNLLCIEVPPVQYPHSKVHSRIITPFVFTNKIQQKFSQIQWPLQT